MNFSGNNTNKMNYFERSSFLTRRESIRNSLLSRGLSIVFRSSKIFTDEEEKDIMESFQSFADEQLTEELNITPAVFLHQDSLEPEVESVSFQPTIPQHGPVIGRIISAPSCLPSSWQSQELDESSCNSSTSCISTSERQSSCSPSQSSSPVDEPGQWDIVCGRNSGGFQYVGNRRFRVTVLMNMSRYLGAPTRDLKTQVIQSIVRTLQDEVGARFLRKINKKEYRVLNDREVRNKVAHTMRDMVQEYRRKCKVLKAPPKLADSPLRSKRKFRRVDSMGGIDTLLEDV
jgi:hypothetical protein